MGCCEALGNTPTTPGGTVSIVNVGGSAEFYKNGTGPNPFELRTLYSLFNTVGIVQETDRIRIDSNTSTINEGTGADVYDTTTSTAVISRLRRIRAGNASVTVTQNATDISITANLPAVDTCANVGTGADVYVNGSSAPFNFRKLNSADARITITENTNDITFQSNLTVANEGAGAQVYDTTNSTISAKILRSIRSSDGSVLVTQGATDINLQVTSAPIIAEAYYSEKTDIITTNGTAYVTVSTMDAMSAGNTGEIWHLVCSCEICHPPGLSTVNTRIRWQIETSAGVFTDVETNINTCEPITIGVGERSSPRTRTYRVTLAMNNPRVRLGMSMSAAVATGGQVEYANVSGYRVG